MTGRQHNQFQIPDGVDHVISVRQRWSGGQAAMTAGHIVIRIWHHGGVEDIAGPLSRADALQQARAAAVSEHTVYMRAPDDPDPVGHSPLFGHVPGVSVGERFRRRKDLIDKRVVRVTQQGIDYCSEGALAIVFSGGYPDDAWSDDGPWYTGEGGQETPGGRQARDQELTRGNRALMQNMREGLPVRVVRKVNQPDGDYEFEYEGLFYIVDFMFGPSREGPRVYRFQLRPVETTS